MRTVGEILREKRLTKGLTLDKAAQATKIRIRFLEAIENDDYHKLPSLSYSKGFVKNYSEFLGLNSNDVLAFFRRQTSDTVRTSIVPKGVADPLNKPVFQLTPSRFLASIFGFLFILFLLYFVYQYKRLYEPPILTIESPQEKLVTTERRIDVLGKTDPDATVTINGVSVLVRSDGKFFDQLSLVPGVNTIEIVATSRYGKTTLVRREVGAQEISQ